MYLEDKDKKVGSDNFLASIGHGLIHREALAKAADPSVPRDQRYARYFGYQKPERPLRVGLIGAGQHGRRLLAAMSPGYLELAAIADVRPSSRALAQEAAKKAFGEKHPLAVYNDYGALLEAAKKDGLEGVIIALPTLLQPRVALKAIEADLHVFVETPIACTLAECKQVLRAAAAKDKLCLGIGHQRRYSLVYDGGLALARSAAFGRLHYIRAQWNEAEDENGRRPPAEIVAKGSAKDAEDPAASILDAARKALKEAKGKVDAAKKAKIDPKPFEPAVKRAEADLKALELRLTDQAVDAAAAGFEPKDNPQAALAELICWPLFQRPGGGMIAQLGTHLFDAVNLVVGAVLGGGKPLRPLSIAGGAAQALKDSKGDADDHVYCILEYPGKEYRAGPIPKAEKKLGVQLAMIRGNGFEGYGETILGTDGSLVLDSEQRGMFYKVAATSTNVCIKKTEKEDPKDKTKKVVVPVIDDRGDDDLSAGIAQSALAAADPGFAAELEHWAANARKPDPGNPLRCTPQQALDNAVIVAAAAAAIRDGVRVEFKREWFDLASDAGPG